MNARESEGGRAAGLEWCVHLPESMRPQKKRLVEPSVTTLCLGVQWMWEVSTAMANLGLRLPLPLACKEVHAYLARDTGRAWLFPVTQRTEQELWSEVSLPSFPPQLCRLQGATFF
jgi:hypothetical protein